MSGFNDHGLAEDAFGASKGGVVSSFDAFPKTKQAYLVQGRNSSPWTVTLILTCIYLSWSEITRWYAGSTSQSFSVEKGVSHDMQINIDIIVAMGCHDLRVNMQDAAGDRTLAGDLLRTDPTNWAQWTGQHMDKGMHELGKDDSDPGWEELWDVHEQLGKARKRKFAKTPRVRGPPTACRIYGSIEGNKVQGDFHITARGHGYQEFGELHLDHQTFNFSHVIREMSFGPYFPSLTNPLDNTIAFTPTSQDHFYKFQYYLSIVPTIYTDDASLVPLLEAGYESAKSGFGTHAMKTNQYAVTSQSRAVPDNYVPGIFVKFDIEPLMLAVVEEFDGFWRLIVRLVNVVSGVLVAGSWAWQMYEWGLDVWGKKGGRRRTAEMGMLGTPNLERSPSYFGNEKKSWD
ncbi:hypothetical protein ACEQ8H_002512 [Pleosporales sp. CAS-2024a]